MQESCKAMWEVRYFGHVVVSEQILHAEDGLDDVADRLGIPTKITKYSRPLSNATENAPGNTSTGNACTGNHGGKKGRYACMCLADKENLGT